MNLLRQFLFQANLIKETMNNKSAPPLATNCMVINETEKANDKRQQNIKQYVT
jgi:hypothetical protein